MIVPSFVERVVKSCLQIGKDDKVAIFTWRHTLDLAEAFAVACERAGAHVHTEFTTDDLWYDTVLNRPIDFLETPDQFDLALGGNRHRKHFHSGSGKSRENERSPS